LRPLGKSCIHPSPDAPSFGHGVASPGVVLTTPYANRRAPFAKWERIMNVRNVRGLKELLVHARGRLGMTQKEFGEVLGASHRTASRWEAGGSLPYTSNLVRLLGLLVPKDAELAAELAVHAGGTLESLGIVAPRPAPASPPAPEPLPARLLVDSVVCAAADTLDVVPATLREALFAAFRRARELRLSVGDVEAALAPVETPEATPTGATKREPPRRQGAKN
jgi:transcriptional regulator with XRE-family HTH domain